LFASTAEGHKPLHYHWPDKSRQDNSHVFHPLQAHTLLTALSLLRNIIQTTAVIVAAATVLSSLFYLYDLKTCGCIDKLGCMEIKLSNFLID